MLYLGITEGELMRYKLYRISQWLKGNEPLSEWEWILLIKDKEN